MALASKAHLGQIDQQSLGKQRTERLQYTQKRERLKYTRGAWGMLTKGMGSGKKKNQ